MSAGCLEDGEPPCQLWSSGSTEDREALPDMVSFVNKRVDAIYRKSTGGAFTVVQAVQIAWYFYSQREASLFTPAMSQDVLGWVNRMAVRYGHQAALDRVELFGGDSFHSTCSQTGARVTSLVPLDLKFFDSADEAAEAICTKWPKSMAIFAEHDDSLAEVVGFSSDELGLAAKSMKDHHAHITSGMEQTAPGSHAAPGAEAPDQEKVEVSMFAGRESKAIRKELAKAFEDL